MRITLFLLFLIIYLIPVVKGKPISATEVEIMPYPAQIKVTNGQLCLSEKISFQLSAPEDSRVKASFNRFLERLRRQTGLKLYPIVQNTNDSLTIFNISTSKTGQLKVGEDESYILEINTYQIMLQAPTDLGILHGLETLLQLIKTDSNGYYLPLCTIYDVPRFPWRGLMIDVCRHFMPFEMIKRNIDGMAMVKLNVLHLHLSEDQGFRVECKTFPRLHQMGSDGNYFSHEQIREIISYAGDRGIRVVPEFDIPGHATSWFVGYPEFASAPGPYSIERKYGVFDPTFDPTNKQVYPFFDAFFKEMAALFPDEYFHIGGDENNGNQWNANEKIQSYMKANNISDNHSLQANFNLQILKSLTRYKKKMIGWDEIFQSQMPTNIIIHSWRGREAMVEAARKGYNSILSNGYYIDLCQTTEDHYLNDPLPDTIKLSEVEKKHILGGEATMWAELVTDENVDSRIWPRTAAIAERLWSPSTVNDLNFMYQRLDKISLQLEEVNLCHIKNQSMMLRRLIGNEPIPELYEFIKVVEPLKFYQRHQFTSYTQFTPLVRLVDISVPDAITGRNMRLLARKFNETGDTLVLNQMIEEFSKLKNSCPGLKTYMELKPGLKEAVPMIDKLNESCIIGIEIANYLKKGQKSGEKAIKKYQEQLAQLKEPVAEMQLTVIQAIEIMTNRLQ